MYIAFGIFASDLLINSSANLYRIYEARAQKLNTE